MRIPSDSSRAVAVAAALALATLTILGCTADSQRATTAGGSAAGASNLPEPADPYVLVLGTAQDNGLPHIGCDTGNCAAARRDPSRRRLVTSLMLCDPRSGKRWLFDCTPDVGEELERARGLPKSRATPAVEAATRPPPFDRMFLTHAHMGHYGGLLQLGREALAVKEIPTFVTPRFAKFLRDNDPWKLMVVEQRIVLHELTPGVPVELAPDLHVDCFRVPHRDEFSDTVGFLIHGPHRTLAYLPDIDKWEKWESSSRESSPDAVPNATAEPTHAEPTRVESLIERVDVALLDGCFYADGELSGRSMKEVPHPFIAESIERFRTLAPEQRGKVFFTHLNHTNPAADPDSDATRAVDAAGMHVLREGRVFGL